MLNLKAERVEVLTITETSTKKLDEAIKKVLAERPERMIKQIQYSSFPSTFGNSENINSITEYTAMIIFVNNF